MDILFTRFCGRNFGDFRGMHSMLSMRAFGMCSESPATRDESSRRESRKKGRVGMCANALGDPREGTSSPGKEMRHCRHVIVCGKKTLVPEG